METEGARKNHKRSCTGGEIGRDGRRECGRCGARSTYGNYARHVRGCVRGEGERNDREARGRVKECDRCGRVLTVAKWPDIRGGVPPGGQGGSQVLDEADVLLGGEEEEDMRKKSNVKFLTILLHKSSICLRN